MSDANDGEGGKGGGRKREVQLEPVDPVVDDAGVDWGEGGPGEGPSNVVGSGLVQPMVLVADDGENTAIIGGLSGGVGLPPMVAVYSCDGESFEMGHSGSLLWLRPEGEQLLLVGRSRSDPTRGYALRPGYMNALARSVVGARQTKRDDDIQYATSMLWGLVQAIEEHGDFELIAHPRAGCLAKLNRRWEVLNRGPLTKYYQVACGLYLACFHEGNTVPDALADTAFSVAQNILDFDIGAGVSAVDAFQSWFAVLKSVGEGEGAGYLVHAMSRNLESSHVCEMDVRVFIDFVRHVVPGPRMPAGAPYDLILSAWFCWQPVVGSGCWDYMQKDRGSSISINSLATMYRPIGRATHFLLGGTKTASPPDAVAEEDTEEGNDTYLWAFSEIPVKVDRIWFELNFGAPGRTSCHHPFLCEISNVKKNYTKALHGLRKANKALKDAKADAAKAKGAKAVKDAKVSKAEGRVTAARHLLKDSFAPSGTPPSEKDSDWAEGTGKATSHTCGRPSHLFLGPEALNKHSEGLNLLGAHLLKGALGVDEAMTADVAQRRVLLGALGAKQGASSPSYPGEELKEELKWGTLRK